MNIFAERALRKLIERKHFSFKMIEAKDGRKPAMFLRHDIVSIIDLSEMASAMKVRFGNTICSGNVMPVSDHGRRIAQRLGVRSFVDKGIIPEELGDGGVVVIDYTWSPNVLANTKTIEFAASIRKNGGNSHLCHFLELGLQEDESAKSVFTTTGCVVTLKDAIKICIDAGVRIGAGTLNRKEADYILEKRTVFIHGAGGMS